MGIWSRVSQLLWREAEVVAEAPESAAPREGSGAPEFLRQAVRFAMAGTVATVLTAQVIGVQLVVPAEAGPYETCVQNCRVSALIPCHAKCDRDWNVAEGNCGRDHNARLRLCPGYPTFRTPAQIACRDASSAQNRACQAAALAAKRVCDAACENCSPSISAFRACLQTQCGSATVIPCSAH